MVCKKAAGPEIAAGAAARLIAGKMEYWMKWNF